MKRVLAVVAVLGIVGLALAGCAPKYPNDAEHQGGLSSSDNCIECHFYGDGPSPPDDHWDGSGNVTYDHSICAYCHTAA